jgi:hypothetical protein
VDPALGIALLALVGTTVSGVLTYRASVRATRVQESGDQRQWALDATHEARAIRQELVQVRREAEALEVRLHRLVMAIHSPGMTVERLQAMVPLNGFTLPDR